MVFLVRIGSVKKRLFALFFLLFTVGIASADLVVGSLSQSPANPVAPGTTVVYSFSVGSTLPALPVVPSTLLKSDLIDDDKKHEDRRGNTFNLSINTGSALDKRRVFLAPPECTQQARSINVFKCKLEPGEKALYKFSHTIEANEEGFSASFRVNCDDFEGDLKNICTVSGMNPQKINTKVGNAPTPGTVEFSAATYFVKEGEGDATITVRRTGGSDGEVSVSYATSSGSATAGSDYTETSGILTWKAGDNEDKSFTIPVADDKLKEGIETVALTLSTLNKSTILGKLSKATLNIADSTVLTPGALEFSSAVYSVKEDEEKATITVRRVGGSDGEVSVSYATSAGTATAGSDYTETSGTLAWKDGDLADKSFTVAVAADKVDEETESLALTLTGDAVGESFQATLNIKDSPPIPVPGVIEFSSAVYSVKEGEGEATITVQRVDGKDGEVSVSYATTAGTAAAGSDYTETSGTLTWKEGDLADKSFTIPVMSDKELEDNESVNLTLKGTALGERAEATLNIADSTELIPGKLAFNQALYTIKESKGEATITVQRVGGSDGTVSVSYATSDGTAAAGSDYTKTSGTLTWKDGDLADQSFKIPVMVDEEDEETERLALTLTGDTLGEIFQATLEIEDSTVLIPGTLEFSSAVYSVKEGEGEATITVQRVGGSDGEVSVSYATTAGTATAGSDYTETSGTLTWKEGDLADKSFTIPVMPDKALEKVESVNLTLKGAALGERVKATLNIADSTELVPGALEFSQALYTTKEGDGEVTITVQRVGGSDGEVSVSYATSAGTATAGSDYTETSGTLTWKEGNLADKSFTIPVMPDKALEKVESVNLTLKGAALGERVKATLNIEDSTELTTGELRFSADKYSVKEDDGSATITVQRVGGSDGEVSVSYATSAGTATAGSDYTETSGTLTWKEGDLADKSFTVAVMADKALENSESVGLTLMNSTGTTLGKRFQAILNIEDSTVLTSGALEFNSAVYSVKEGDGEVTITVRRVDGSDGEVSASYETRAGTATAGSDYTTVSGTLVWGDGDSSDKEFKIAVTDDSLREDVETVSLTLGALNEGTILGERADAVLNIADSTELVPGALEFSQALYTVKENEGEITITVQRVGGSDGRVSVSYAIADGTATVGSDYTAAPGNLVWEDGDSSNKEFTVTVVDDDLKEEIETVSLTLSALSEGATLAEISSATLNIVDSSVTTPGEIKFSAATYSVKEDAGSVTITAQRIGGSDGDVSVQYDSRNGDAIAGSDYQAVSGRLTWVNGDVADKTFTIAVEADSTVEESENVVLSLSSPEGGAALGSPSSATLEIMNVAGTRGEVTDAAANNIGTLKFKKETFWALEEKGKAMVAVSRSAGSRGEVSVTVEIDGGTALDSNVLTWADGESVDKTLEISIQQGETEKPVKLRLVNATGGVRIDNTREVTLRIVDNASGFSKEQPKLDDKQQVIAEVLDKSCASLDDGEIVELKDQDKLELCVALTESADDLPSLQNALQQLSPEKVIAQAKSSVEALNVQNNNISSRISALRMGVRGLSINQLSLSVDGQQLSGALFSSLLPYAQGGGASADGFSKFGFFSNGTIALGDSEGGANQSGYDFSTKGVTFGVDYRYRSDLVMGVAVGVADTRADIEGNSGEMRINNNSLSLYGSYYQNSQFYLDGIVNFGWSRLDSMRKIEISTINQIAEGETNGNEYSLGVSSGYDFAHKGLSFGPYGSFNYVVANIDGYDERSSDGSSSAVLLAIGEQKVTSMSSALGAQASYAISTQKGVFIPKLSFDWEREYKDDSRLITARFLNDTSNTIFSVSTDEPDRSYFNMNIGFSAVLSQGRSGFVNYSQVIGRDKIKTYSLSGGVRLEF